MKTKKKTIQGVLLLAVLLSSVTGCALAANDERTEDNASAQNQGPTKPPPRQVIPPQKEGESIEDYINRLNKGFEEEQKAEEAQKAKQKKAFEDDQKLIEERLKSDRAKLLELARVLITDKDKLATFEDRLDEAIEKNNTKDLDKIVEELMGVLRQAVTDSELGKEIDALIKRRDELRALIDKAEKDRLEQMKDASADPYGGGGAVLGIQLADALGIGNEKKAQVELSQVIDKINALLSKYNPNVEKFNEVQDALYETIRRQMVHDKLLELMKIIDDTLLIEPKDPATLKNRDWVLYELEMNRLTPEERMKREKEKAPPPSPMVNK